MNPTIRTGFSSYLDSIAVSPAVIRLIINDDHIDLVKKLNTDCMGAITSRLGVPHSNIP